MTEPTKKLIVELAPLVVVLVAVLICWLFDKRKVNKGGRKN